MGDTYERARLAILSDLLSFPMIRQKDWQEDPKPNPGSLVTLSSAPNTKWYCSWVEQVELHEGGWHRYLLRSIDDWELCWWENVMICRYNPETVKNHPEWKWSDKQFAFWDRWRRVCYKENDTYIVLPGVTTFLDAGAVRLTLREQHAGYCDDPFQYEKNFASWRRLTMKEMGAFYLDGCERYRAHADARKARRERLAADG